MARRTRPEFPPQSENLISDDTMNRHTSGAVFEMSQAGNLISISGPDTYSSALDRIIDNEDQYISNPQLSQISKIECTVQDADAVVVVEVDPRLLP